MKSKMEETTVTEMDYFVHDYPLTEYAYCPYCGRKIVAEE